MPLRVRIRIEAIAGEAASGKQVETIAVGNSGFESSRAQINVPIRLAAALGLWPTLPPDTEEVTYRTAGGSASVFRIQNGGHIYAVTPDRTVGPVSADLVVNSHSHRVLMSDQLVGSLGIVLLDFGKGLWRFSDEPDVERPSEPSQDW